MRETKQSAENKDFERELNDFKILFGKRVKYYRDLRNFTQEYLAELVNIEQASLSNIERGKSHPTVETLYRLAYALGVKPYQFYNVELQIPVQDMINEITNAMNFDNKLTELLYKFFSCVR